MLHRLHSIISASHLFLQIPLEGHKDDPSTVEHILRQRPRLPQVVALHHLGYAAGEEAFNTGLRDVAIGHFKDGMWGQDDLGQTTFADASE